MIYQKLKLASEAEKRFAFTKHKFTYYRMISFLYPRRKLFQLVHSVTQSIRIYAFLV